MNSIWRYLILFCFSGLVYIWSAGATDHYGVGHLTEHVSEDSFPKQRPAVYPPKRVNLEAKSELVADLMRMSIEEIISHVPQGTGIYFVGCPNCKGGAQESGVLEWKLGMGDQVKCKYCSMIFPNAKFPNNRKIKINSPGGSELVYEFYEDSTGYHYYFNAHAWYERWEWIRNQAKHLAELWYATKDPKYGDRAAAIIGKFAHLFPDYPVRYDYPNANVKFFPANQKWPYEGLDPYRGAKWRRWAYDDIPNILAEVFDLLHENYDWRRMESYLGADLDKRIVRDLLRLGYEFTIANPERYSNKSPGLYNQMIRLGRIIGEPSYVHEAVKRFREFCSNRFFRDGWWFEGSTAYHAMAVRGLREAIQSSRGYTDPRDWNGPERFRNLNLVTETPQYQKAQAVTRDAILPNGRRIPINDTWWYNMEETIFDGKSKLWDGLGNALITFGGKNASAININWSGNYSHTHYDNGSILLFAYNKELLSDIGYSHTRYRGWTKHTASHNTVLIDQKGQSEKSHKWAGTGRLLHYDDTHDQVKTVWVDASPSYPDAKIYQRRIIAVRKAEGQEYFVDIFDVEGGSTQDYFLHGSADEDGLVSGLGEGMSLPTLKPTWGGSQLPKEQHDLDLEGKTYHPYIHFTNIVQYDFIDSIQFSFHYKDTGLQVYHFLPGKHQLFAFENPSVRRALENENDLDKFKRKSIMVRANRDRNQFISVMAPFAGKSWMHSVKRVGNNKIVVTSQINNRLERDTIELLGERIVVNIGRNKKYDSGLPIAGELESLVYAKGKYCLKLVNSVATNKTWVRMIFPDGSSQYHRIAGIGEDEIQLKDDPGFKLDGNQNIIFKSFPQRELKGKIKLIFFD